ncbi:cysteine-rich receptor-like protein kinase 21 [Actinidia eriantha]|uniref:cysteine-rich receptor-like protein kinase 21 n=1 Tax=Actinidia eriantha TaxID=165200 RepID=UPI00258D19FF|nr:cysteine-rich receptor-like protein kinase 21 [Actinidia eriantha]XP_057514836.1 cysteine-rich receptor-like protein kinase 21 [Actinidia eriantha]XP_057514837.1 cysteine-rich receptor-like protein kinase 21 [Actinidia eriantha]
MDHMLCKHQNHSSEMALTIIATASLFLLFLSFQLLPCSCSQTWIKAGYWFSGSDFPISNVSSPLFSHLICAFAGLNSSTYHLSLSSSDTKSFSNFTTTVQQKNPSVLTLLSIGGGSADSSVFSSMVSQSNYRKSFIESSIETARSYGFHGLDFCWVSASNESEMANIATLFDEWRSAVESEARNSNESQLILTMAVQYSPYLDNTSFPIESIKKNLNWVHVMAYDYYMPTWWNHTRAFAALYDPGSEVSTDYGINAWINAGLTANKLVLGLPFYGYAWTLVNPNDNAIGAPAKGPAITDDGSMSYKDIKGYIKRYGAVSNYNATYVVNYCIIGSSCIVFDDVEVVKTKVAYAKKMDLLGFFVWQVPYDDNWELSQAAQDDEKDHSNKRTLWLKIFLPTVATVIILLGFTMWYLRKRVRRFKGFVDGEKEFQSLFKTIRASTENTNSPNLHVFRFTDLVAATNNFSFENKLGEGGYGPVYKGNLQSGQEIAVKRLSKTSKQGFEEFKNEVLLTAKLQHVNLVRVLGFCTEREEQMLIYEYMPNKSLDYYIYDPIRRLLLDWEKRVEIIEGITQGLLYLQEYSRLTIIHRDLKASNILLDYEMKPKIADFGMAKIFQKDAYEANTDRIVGTYGYVPPEYVKRGIYSTKSDVYSFGVLLLQIISGKMNNCFYGLHEDLNLLEYAFELLKNGNGMEFMDPSLEDTNSSCKLLRCMLIALLCVQENPADRPSMLEVSSMLNYETAAMNFPKRPAFSKKRDEDNEAKVSTSQLEIWSVDNESITQVVAR